MTNAKSLRIEERPIGELKPFLHNARKHTKKQIHQIAAFISEFGFTNPILIDQFDFIIAGHGRIDAARQLGFHTVPTIRIEYLSEAQKRAYVIADNKLALNAGWDPEILAIEFQHLSSLDLDFDLELTGFETAEIDILVDGHKSKAKDPADLIPFVEQTVVSRPGDLWRMGPHKLLCGDARDPDDCARLIGSDKARLMFTDQRSHRSKRMRIRRH